MMRILCLHGMGTSGDIFEMQTAGLRHELGGDAMHSYEFVDGSLSWPAAPAVQALFPYSGDFWAYYDAADARSVLAALDDLTAFVAREGPFDGVMGFSQGAALAAMLLLRPAAAAPFSFAVFICAGAPFCEATLRDRGEVRLLHADVDAARITVPTAHITGALDDKLSNARRLARLCEDRLTSTYDHGARHEIPFHPKSVVAAMARCVEDTITKAFVENGSV